MDNQQQLQQALERLRPLPLIQHLTPLHPLPRLSAALGGPEIWIKRDDLTGLGLGGNKVRKLTFLVSEALEQNADTLVTGGARQSNHARQTAAAAANVGRQCVLVLGGTADQPPQGNHLLDKLLGAEVRWSGERHLSEALEAETEALRRAGRRPYLIPYGGSNGLGACGYAAAVVELAQQAATQEVSFDAIVIASSSGGTQAGLVLGTRALGLATPIVGISIAEDAPRFRQRIADLANAAAARLELVLNIQADEVVVNDAYLGAGYGQVSILEREAIQCMARNEGLLLDPVYTGRAFGGLLDLIRQGQFHSGQRVLFWHTGGAPALFAYAEELV